MISPKEFDELSRRDFMTFIHRSFLELNPETQFQPNWHIELIAAKLEKVARGEIRRLIINLPPRHLKSIATSIGFVSWWLGHHPSGHVIAASYGQDLATKFARDTRTIMSTFWYERMFSTRVSTQQRATDDFATVQGGTRMATSVGGPLTGRGGDIIIIDDAMKPEDALSETLRKKANDWFDSTVLSRLNDKKTGAIVIIMQRLHLDDLVGHVLQQADGDWDVLCFPAIAESDETHIIENAFGRRTVSRKAGEALHPARESLDSLLALRRQIGGYNFAGQYQQSPTPKGGAMIRTDWIKHFSPQDLPRYFSSKIQSWDTANKTSELNDFSVCTTWGLSNGRFFLLDVFRKRLNYPDLKRAVLEQKQKHNPTAIVIEDKASGTQLIQDLKADGLYNVKGIEHLPGVDKIMRLHAKTVLFENGAVLLPQQAPFLEEYIKELTGFPGTRFDDQVDSTTQALDYLQGPGRIVDTWIKAFG